ncbi:hypothetical protein COLO4_06909 [Corchorus olitorius]|uniref:F-box protein n=1 Tax=Corchorus olitorius TaxID=93759 RepID=A0A1R3KLI7_9ROSI|nr:hypothetical protein COLO4_06909 [Corchorus olitorius]
MATCQVKSIVRFRSLAKTWNSLLQNPGFVSNHLSNTKKKKDRRLLVYHYNQVDKKFFMRKFNDQTLVSYQDYDLDLDLLTPKPSVSRFTFCVNDGLCCAYDRSTSRIGLWNPGLKEFRILPNPICFPNGKFIHLGIGWDSSSNDGEFGTSSANGVHYWAPLVIGNNVLKLLAFHIGDETFQLIDWPNDKFSESSYGGLFRLIVSRRGLITVMMRMRGFWNDVKEVLVDSVMGNLLLKELDTKESTTLDNNYRFRDLLEVFTYEETLIPIKL